MAAAARHPLAVLALAALGNGCASDPSAPSGATGLSFDLDRLAAGARVAGIPTDSFVVVLRRVSDSSVAFTGAYADDLLGQVTGTRIVRARIPLRVSPEDFLLHLELRGGGTTYYARDARVTVIAGVGVTTPPLSLEYVGPGRGADSLVFVLVPPVIPPGDSVLAAALVYQQGLLLPGVPVAYGSSDSSRVRVHPSGLGLAWLVADAAAAGTVTITAATPTGLSRTAGLMVLSPAASLEAIAGAGQLVPLGLLSQPLVVRVLDARGAPFTAGFPVVFSLTDAPPGAALTDSEVISDSQGFAATRLLAGSATGPARVAASGQGLPSTPDFVLTLVTTLTGLADLSAVTAVLQSAVVNQLVGLPPAVMLRDSASRPVAGVPVGFSILSGGGRLNGLGSAVSVISDSQGVARLASWRAGTAVGAQVVQAAVSGLPAVRFTATAAPTAVGQIRKLAGDNQTGPLGAPLPQPLQVQVLDSFANPIPGAPVRWTSTDGLLTPESTASDSAGRASARWTLGTLDLAPTATAAVGAVQAVFRASVLP